MDARSYLSNNVRYEILGKPALPANFWATAVSISVSVMLSRSPSSFGGLQQHRMRRRHNAKKTEAGSEDRNSRAPASPAERGEHRHWQRNIVYKSLGLPNQENACRESGVGNAVFVIVQRARRTVRADTRVGLLHQFQDMRQSR